MKKCGVLNSIDNQAETKAEAVFELLKKII
jgi:hypothetical protein